MHMADALLSTVVGGTFWAISGMFIGYSAKKITEENDPVKTPLMGALGAFVFAAQMINFSIPGTGSSGHLGGGVLLTVLLGPYRAFITLASVLIIQCLFFADGGVLALGCNIFNLAFFPAFIAYPFIYRFFAGTTPSPRKLAAGSITAATAALLMGSISVVLQTVLSGISELPFSIFALFMLPIHLAIGITEGVVTWAVLSFLLKTAPHLVTGKPLSAPPRFIFAAFTIVALMVGGIGSWFASPHPDGHEWSMAKVTGSDELSRKSDPVHEILASFQKKIAFFPDYGFKTTVQPAVIADSPVNPGTTVSGIVGALSVLVAAGMAGLALGKKRPQPKSLE